MKAELSIGRNSDQGYKFMVQTEIIVQMKFHNFQTKHAVEVYGFTNKESMELAIIFSGNSVKFVYTTRSDEWVRIAVYTVVCHQHLLTYKSVKASMKTSHLINL